MATRQYIGARYIPVFADPVEWDATRPYDYLTMVQHVGETYMSKQSVPIGAPLPDAEHGEESTDYWVHMSNWNAQVESYRQEVLAYNGRISTLEDDLPIADFDSTNTVKKYIDDEISDVEEVLPATDFDSTNTVKKYIDDEISDVEEVLPATDFDSVNTVKKYIDDGIGKLETTVNGEFKAIEETINDIIDNGYIGVSTDLNNPNRPAYAMYTNDLSSLHYVDKFIPDYFGLDKLTPVNSSCLAKIDGYYYYQPNTHYAYSDDFENWAYATLDNIQINPLYAGGDVWGPNGIEKIGDKIYWFGSVQYKSGTLATYNLIDAFGESNSTPKKACYIELTQNDDGSLSIADNAIWTPFSCTNIDNTSYIDPYMIYSEVLNCYILAVKNEITKKIEVYSGNAINNMSQVSINDNLFGVEGVKLIETKNAVYMIGSIYDLCGYGHKTAGCVDEQNPAECVAFARLTNALGTDWMPRVRWSIIREPINCRHLALLKCDANIARFINKTGYDSFTGYRYNGYQDNLRVGFSAPTSQIDDTAAYGNFYINIANAPGVNYSLAGNGQYTNTSAVTKDIPLNSLLIFDDEDNDNYLISRYTSSFNYKLGSGLLGTLTGKKITNNDTNLVLGKFVNFNNSQCAYLPISGLES